MPIPPFNAAGNLSIGQLIGRAGWHASIVPVTLSEAYARFVETVADSGSPSRSEIWEGWMRHRAAFGLLGIPFATLVDGSFISTKPNPGDIDLCILFDADRVNRLDATSRAKFLN